MVEYEHTQAGTVLRGILGTIVTIMTLLAGGVWLADITPAAISLSISAAICALILLLFHNLTVRVTHHDVQLIFGIGLIRKSFILDDVAAIKIVRNPWYYGWGIKMIPKGWLYNVSGLDAVELQTKLDRRYRIGTDQPQELHAALAKHIGSAIEERRGL